MTTEKIKVLYVDDEENNLVSFQAKFRKEYDVYTANGAEEALILLKNNRVNIIISDQRMPYTTGVEFLEQTVKLYPDCIRLLITGQSDIDDVIEAINRGQVSKFIKKPWDWEKFSLAIDHCATLYKSRIELNHKNEELQKINEELSKFAYSVSHDLRSPLTSILGVINLTKIMPELRAADPYFEMIEGRVVKLDSFIKKIINSYKNSKIEQVNEVIDLKLLISKIWDSLKNQNNSINFTLSINQEYEYVGDYFRLEIVLENLISNAIKYQNPSEKSQFIKINADINSKNARITISDNGIGIDKIYFEDIFKLFFRTEDVLNTEGSGIGLYIVKEAVEKMQGKIEVSSEPKSITSFELIIPNNNNK